MVESENKQVKKQEKAPQAFQLPADTANMLIQRMLADEFCVGLIKAHRNAIGIPLDEHYSILANFALVKKEQ